MQVQQDEGSFQVMLVALMAALFNMVYYAGVQAMEPQQDSVQGPTSVATTHAEADCGPLLICSRGCNILIWSCNAPSTHECLSSSQIRLDLSAELSCLNFLSRRGSMPLHFECQGLGQTVHLTTPEEITTRIEFLLVADRLLVGSIRKFTTCYTLRTAAKMISTISSRSDVICKHNSSQSLP